MNKQKKLREIINNNDNIVFFGGAGVSVPSGIPDFRGSGGMGAKRIPFEVILSRDYFLENTEKFYEIYRKSLIFPNAEPNKAHTALAHLEEIGKLNAVITQNIDNLHQMAGSKNVIELHGSVYRNYCMSCNKKYEVDKVLESDTIPYCDCGGIIRPDVVLYQEPLNSKVLSAAVTALTRAKVLIVSGTSLVVHPAAGLINYFHGNNLVIINKSKTGYDSRADLVIYDSVDDVLNAAIN